MAQRKKSLPCDSRREGQKNTPNTGDSKWRGNNSWANKTKETPLLNGGDGERKEPKKKRKIPVIGFVKKGTGKEKWEKPCKSKEGK